MLMVSLVVEKSPGKTGGRKKSRATIITASFMRAKKVKGSTKTIGN